MKKIAVIGFLFALLFFPLKKVFLTVYYSQFINSELYSNLKTGANLLFDKNILITNYDIKFHHYSNLGKWNNYDVRLSHENIQMTNENGFTEGSVNFLIEIKLLNENSWMRFFQSSGCHSDHALIHGDTLLYFCDHVPIINQKGEVLRNLLPWWLTINGPQQVIQIDRKLYFIENDSRLQWITPRSLLSGELAGPNLITATEIDLDTLAYKEHIIGYDDFWVEDEV